MADAAGAARLILAAVFLVAGWAKLADRAATRRAVANFGVPDSLGGPTAVALPVVELSIALALLLPAVARAAAVAAIVVIALFIFGIGVNLAQGRRPDCSCFGQMHSAPIGQWTLVRNVALIGLATLVALEGSGSFVGSWFDRATVTQLVIGLGAIAIVGGLAWSRRGGKPLGRRAASHPNRSLSLGSPAPPFSLRSTGGPVVSLASLVAQGRPVLVVFTTANCMSCATLLPEIATWQRERADVLTCAVIGSGNVTTNVAKFASAGVANAMATESDAVATSFGYSVAPCALLVSTDGAIASELVVGAEAITALVLDASST